MKCFTWRLDHIHINPSPFGLVVYQWKTSSDLRLGLYVCAHACTHARALSHTDFADKSNFKQLSMCLV